MIKTRKFIISSGHTDGTIQEGLFNNGFRVGRTATIDEEGSPPGEVTNYH